MLVDTVTLVLIQHGTTPNVLSNIKHLGAVEGVDNQTAMGDAVAALQRQIEIPVETTQFGASAGQHILMEVLFVAPLQLAREITNGVLLLCAIARWGHMI